MIAIFIICYIFGAILLEHDIKDIAIGKTLALTGFGASTICLIFVLIYPLYIQLNEYFEDKKPNT